MRHKMSAFVHLSLRHGQQLRRNLVCGAGAQDACVITLLKPPRLIHPSLLLVSSSHGGRSSGEIRCSSSSLWRRVSVSTNASVESGEAQTIEQVWKEYFADPLQWWDNRVDKMNPKSPDFKHKVTKKALWVDNWSTPPWVKGMLKLPPHVGYHTSDSQNIVQPNRLPKGNFGRRNTLPTSARDSKHTVQVGRGSNRMQSAKTTSEAIDGLKNRLQQGIAIDSYMYVEVLKRCLKQEDLTAVKQVHGCVIESGMQQNIYVANSLLIAYIRYGRLQDARRLFDELVKKDVISWNVMIRGYAEHRRAKEAIELFNQMREDGVQPSAVTYMSILKACASPSALKWGKEVHACIKHGGFESDVRVGTALLKMYAKCGSIEAARKFFDKLGSRDVMSWNVMIGAYAESGCGEEAYGLLLQMSREGFKPNAFTYVSILNACASAGALGWVKAVHNQAREAGFELDLRVGSALVHMYAKCGSIDDARLVFDRMKERDVITWNVMIGGLAQHGFGGDAYDMFIRMQQVGFKPDARTYVSILNACASAGALEWVKEVHNQARAAGFQLDMRVCSALVHMYAKCGSIDDARLVFDRMKERDVITWNVMIGGLAQHGFGGDAYDMFIRMQQHGFKPDARTYVNILNACASAGALEWVKKVHDQAREAGYELNLRVGNALVHMFAKCGSMDDARLVFDRMEERDVITWNVMIGGLAQHGFGGDAYDMFILMQQGGFKPDVCTYVNILNACASAGALEWVKKVHNHAREAGVELDLRVGNALVHMYAKCGSMDDAQLVFDRMEDRDVITWNVMIGGLAQHGFGGDAYDMFIRMQQEGFKPDVYTYVNILNACASAGALEWVKAVHNQAREAGLELDLRVGNALVHMYVKCGSMDDARLVFDRMEERDVITWNVMIGGLAQHGFGGDAYDMFILMQQEGFEPDVYTYVSILNACASAAALEWVKEVHNQACVAGYELDLRVGNALVHMYAKCGSMDDARLVFDRMEERDVITWNVMIGGLAQHGFGDDAYDMFIRMQQECFKPDVFTYVSILNACASAGALEWVKEVHNQAREAGYELDLRVGNALVHMYAKCGSMDDARLVFDRMEERDVITWNVMIGGLAQHGFGGDAYDMFIRMQQECFKPDVYTYMNILNACGSAGALGWVKAVHNQARAAGFELDLRVGNALVHMYAKCGSMDDARVVFDRMEERDVITWNVMIGGLAQHGFGDDAYDMFIRMQQVGFEPDEGTYVSILNACASAAALGWVKEVHNQAHAAGFELDLRVGNALVHMYAKCGSMDDARLVFDRMEERDVITWNVMIGGLAQHGFGGDAYDMFIRMQQEGFKPDVYTYVNILNACASAGALEWVKEVHNQAREAGFELDLRVGTALVHMYAKCGSMDDARLVFDRMEDRDVITWNVMIGGLAQHGSGSEALDVFRRMIGAAVKLNGYSFVALLSACSHAGLVDEGRRLFLAMSHDYGISPSVVHWTCMVDILGRAGHLEEAWFLIDSMPVEPDVAAWGALLGACRSYGNVEFGELAAKERIKLELENASTYVLLSNIYAAAAKWEEVSLVRSMMQGRGVRKEPGRSWIEVDNKIHAFVVGDTSHQETKEIYAELSRLTEKIKAEGYLPDTRLVLRDVDEKDKELSLCSHSEKLAIAYGLIRTPSSKPVRVYKNLRVCSDCHTATKLISKVTRKEIVVRDANRFHHFKDGLCSCKDYW